MFEFTKDVFKKFLKSKFYYKIFVAILLFLYVFLIVITTKTVNVIVSYPGYISSVGNYIEIESDCEKGQFYTTSILQNRKISLVEYWLHQHNYSVDLVEYNPNVNLTTAEDYIAGVYYKKNSISKSLIAAYKTANKENSEIDINYEYKGIRVTSIDKQFDNRLKVGDLIIELNEIELLSFEQTLTVVAEINNGTLTDDDYITLKVIRDEISLDILSPAQLLPSGEYGIAIYGEGYYEVINSTPSYTLTENFSATGPSGGLMQTLYIYDALTEFDLTKGLKVAGTGTIEIVYNEEMDNYEYMVGGVGGIKQKLLTAQRNKVEVFFVPKSKYEEAEKVYNKIKKPTFELIEVAYLIDAINWLEGVSNE